MSTSKSKMVIALLFITVFILTLASCSDSSDEQADEASMSGKILTIELEENPTTGFTWSYFASDTTVIELVEDEYLADSEDSDVVGGGGLHQYKFEGLKEGETTLVFDYYKSWEGIESAEDHREYIVTVDQNGTIVDVNWHSREFQCN